MLEDALGPALKADVCVVALGLSASCSGFLLPKLDNIPLTLPASVFFRLYMDCNLQIGCC